MIDESQNQECVGIGENAYLTTGRTKIKITLDGSPVYYFDVWGGDQVGLEAILGMDFMAPAGIRLDLADGKLCVPDEVCIGLAGRKPLYRCTSDQPERSTCGDLCRYPAGVSLGVAPPKYKLWVRRVVGGCQL